MLFHRQGKIIGLVCAYTQSHRLLYEEFFLPSTKHLDFPLLAHPLENEGGTFRTVRWHNAIIKKFNILINTIQRNKDENNVLIWSDVDAQFFGKISCFVLSQIRFHNILFSAERSRGNEINTGFFVMRCNQPVINFLKLAKKRLVKLKKMKRTRGRVDDQVLVNHIKHRINYGILPRMLFWNETVGGETGRNLRYHHANYAFAYPPTDDKIEPRWRYMLKKKKALQVRKNITRNLRVSQK
jgi:hypothetical protein